MQFAKNHATCTLARMTIELAKNINKIAQVFLILSFEFACRQINKYIYTYATISFIILHVTSYASMSLTDWDGVAQPSPTKPLSPFILTLQMIISDFAHPLRLLPLTHMANEHSPNWWWRLRMCIGEIFHPFDCSEENNFRGQGRRREDSVGVEKNCTDRNGLVLMELLVFR